jgi:hypothetical protein
MKTIKKLPVVFGNCVPQNTENFAGIVITDEYVQKSGHNTNTIPGIINVLRHCGIPISMVESCIFPHEMADELYMDTSVPTFDIRTPVSLMISDKNYSEENMNILRAMSIARVPRYEEGRILPSDVRIYYSVRSTSDLMLTLCEFKDNIRPWLICEGENGSVVTLSPDNECRRWYIGSGRLRLARP